VFLLLAYGVGIVLLRRSWIGRFTELIGENETAARFAAIDVARMKLGLYTACGLVCAVAATIHTALYATAKADTAPGMELEAIACVVIGGTRISGGHASMSGTLLGLVLLGLLRFGLEMAGVSSQNIIILVGFVLIATAIANERLSGAVGRRRS
jgi:ribose/xylose/arabinose/galactoside ABC-type transport system permease subunit